MPSAPEFPQITHDLAEFVNTPNRHSRMEHSMAICADKMEVFEACHVAWL